MIKPGKPLGYFCLLILSFTISMPVSGHSLDASIEYVSREMTRRVDEGDGQFTKFGSGSCPSNYSVVAGSVAIIDIQGASKKPNPEKVVAFEASRDPGSNSWTTHIVNLNDPAGGAAPKVTVKVTAMCVRAE